MDAHPFEGEGLTYFLIQPDGYKPGASYPLVILLHGFGASMYDLAGLCPAIDPTGYVYACPNAPFPVELGGGVAYSWSQGMPGTWQPPPGAPTTEERLELFLDEVMEQTRPGRGRVVLAGFSQGGGLALRFGLPRPDVFAGLAVLSGAFRDSADMKERLPAGRAQSVFVAHGLYDPMVGVERGRATKAFLEEQGYPLEYHEYYMAHEITDDVIEDLTPWLHRVLPPLGVQEA